MQAQPATEPAVLAPPLDLIRRFRRVAVVTAILTVAAFLATPVPMLLIPIFLLVTFMGLKGARIASARRVKVFGVCNVLFAVLAVGTLIVSIPMAAPAIDCACDTSCVVAAFGKVNATYYEGLADAQRDRWDGDHDEEDSDQLLLLRGGADAPGNQHGGEEEEEGRRGHGSGKRHHGGGRGMRGTMLGGVPRPHPHRPHHPPPFDAASGEGMVDVVAPGPADDSNGMVVALPFPLPVPMPVDAQQDQEDRMPQLPPNGNSGFVPPPPPPPHRRRPEAEQKQRHDAPKQEEEPRALLQQGEVATSDKPAAAPRVDANGRPRLGDAAPATAAAAAPASSPAASVSASGGGMSLPPLPPAAGPGKHAPPPTGSAPGKYGSEDDEEEEEADGRARVRGGTFFGDDDEDDHDDDGEDGEGGYDERDYASSALASLAMMANKRRFRNSAPSMDRFGRFADKVCASGPLVMTGGVVVLMALAALHVVAARVAKRLHSHPWFIQQDALRAARHPAYSAPAAIAAARAAARTAAGPDAASPRGGLPMATVVQLPPGAAAPTATAAFAPMPVASSSGAGNGFGAAFRSAWDAGRATLASARRATAGGHGGYGPVVAGEALQQDDNPTTTTGTGSGGGGVEMTIPRPAVPMMVVGHAPAFAGGPSPQQQQPAINPASAAAYASAPPGSYLIPTGNGGYTTYSSVATAIYPELAAPAGSGTAAPGSAAAYTYAVRR